MKAKYFYAIIFTVFSASASSAIVITEKDHHWPSDIPYGWAVATLSSTGDVLNVDYRDNKQDGHCPYVKTQRIRMVNGRRSVVGRTLEHRQNCRTGSYVSVSHFVFGDGGAARLCLSGHWYCGRWHDQY